MIPYRGDDMEWRHLKVMGDLGIVAPVTYSPKDIDSVRRAVEGSDIVINLIGKVSECCCGCACRSSSAQATKLIQLLAFA